MSLSSRKPVTSSTGIDEAIEHLTWCARHQEPGYFAIQTLIPHEDGSHRPDGIFWFNNRAKGFRKELRETLEKIDGGRRLVLYTVCAFSKESAKAQYAVPSRLAFVDADQGSRISAVPKPTRIVSSSEFGEHWFYSLDEAAPPAEIQTINRALAAAAGADHGHSPAKKFRLPGFPNLKYSPPILVRVKNSVCQVHKAADLLSLAGEASFSGEPPTVKRHLASTSVLPNAAAVLQRFTFRLDYDALFRIRQCNVCGPFQIKAFGETITYPGDDRSEVIWAIGMALRKVGAKPDEALAVIKSTVFWRSREASGKHEDPMKLIERIYNAELDVNPKAQPSALAVDPATWAGLPVPKREWILRGWVPRKKVTLLYGDGGTGKTLLTLMLAVCCARGLPFLGLKVRQGRVYAFLGENDEDDTRISLDPICKHYGVALDALRGQMLIGSRAEFDNVLMSFRNGDGRHTELFDRVRRDILALNPDLVIFETAAELFEGNENDRGQVTRFVKSCCGRIALEAKAAVILNAHPSVAGLKTGDGSAGSTAWSNSARSRIYLRRDIDDKNREADPDLRILELRKTNFAKVGERMDLRWKDGVFVVEGSADDVSTRTAVEQRLVEEIERAFANRNSWSAHHQAGRRYIVRWICPILKMSETKAKSMLHKLMASDQIVEVEYDRHRHRVGLATAEQAAKQQRS